MEAPSNLFLANKQVYADQAVIEFYATQTYIQEAERLLAELPKDQLAGMAMLDVAVGGGRTALVFSKLVKSYVGIDYSEGMIDICNRRFNVDTGKGPVSFAVVDMRSLDIFAARSFDIVLISNNAISALAHEDRLATFSEVRRVCKPGAYFLFSAHNIQWAYRAFSFYRQLSIFHPKISYWNLLKWHELRSHNRLETIKKIASLPNAIINDGAHEWRLQHYYIKPREQIKQLESYFKEICVLSKYGQKISGMDQLDTIQDPYLYYLCRA